MPDARYINPDHKLAHWPCALPRFVLGRLFVLCGFGGFVVFDLNIDTEITPSMLLKSVKINHFGPDA